MYNLAIGDRTYSSWSLRGWLMFEQFNIPVKIDSARMYSAEFKQMLAEYGGGNTVPAIHFDDGGKVLVSDSLAIAETLAERHPDLNMWPSNPAARGFARAITAEMHAGFTSLRNDCTMNLRHVYKGFQPSDGVQKDVARIDSLWRTARQKFGTAGPWLFGDYSLADAFYAPVATRLLTYDLPCSQTAKDYVQTVISDTAFKNWRADGLAENFVQPGYDLDIETAPWPETDKN